MSISAVVAQLADVVAQVGAPLSAWESRLLEELRIMPLRVDERDLGWWDSRYGQVHFAGPAEEKNNPRTVVRMFDEIFAFGSYNLYTTFDAEGTRVEYSKLVNRLNANLGTQLHADQDVTTW